MRTRLLIIIAAFLVSLPWIQGTVPKSSTSSSTLPSKPSGVKPVKGKATEIKKAKRCDAKRGLIWNLKTPKKYLKLSMIN